MGSNAKWANDLLLQGVSSHMERFPERLKGFSVGRTQRSLAILRWGRMPTGRGFQSRYNAITSQRFYLATKVVDELSCRLAAFKAQCERQQGEWAQFQALANPFKFVQCGA